MIHHLLFVDRDIFTARQVNKLIFQEKYEINIEMFTIWFSMCVCECAWIV